MTFESLKHFLSKDGSKNHTHATTSPLTTEPDERRVTRNKFARLSARTRAA